MFSSQDAVSRRAQLQTGLATRFTSRRGPLHPELAIGLAKGKRKRQGQGKERGVAPLLKSRDPHVACLEKANVNTSKGHETVIECQSILDFVLILDPGPGVPAHHSP